MLFRTLNQKEEQEFREYAERNNPPAEWRTICHPVCVEVWIKRGFADSEGHLPSLLEVVSRINKGHV